MSQRQGRGKKDNEELIFNNKKIQRTTEHYKELQETFSEIQNELGEAKQQLSKSKKLLDDDKVDYDQAEKARIELEVQVKQLQETRAAQEKEIRTLTAKGSELLDQLHQYESQKREFQNQKNKELSDIERQKNLLSIQGRIFGRKLEDERRSLQSQSFESKQEMKRDCKRDVDLFKQHYELEVSSLERQTKTDVAELERKLNKKIERATSDCYNTRAKLEALRGTITKLDEKIDILQKDLKKASTNSEIEGTSTIDWLKIDGYSPEENQQKKMIESKLDELRTQLIAKGEELLLAKRQKVAAERQVKDLKVDLDEQEILINKLEASKKDADRRLSKRIEQLEDQLERKASQVAADYNTQKTLLQSSVEERDNEIKDLRKTLADLQQRFKAANQSSANLITKLNNKFDDERAKYVQTEKEKYDILTENLKSRTEIETMSEKIALLEKESERNKRGCENAQKELSKLQDKNQQIEQNLRKLETSGPKA